MTDVHGSGDLDRQGRALVERLGGRWTAGKGGMCRCPAHDDRHPSLSVRIGQRRLLFHCFAGCAPSRVVAAVRTFGYVASRDDPADRTTIHARTGNGSAMLALRLWRGARPLGGSVAERYLARRGLNVSSEEVRFHPRTPHGGYPLTQFRPALVAAVREADDLVAVHRTFLARDGSGLAALDEPRMGLGPFGSGAVRFGGVARRLGLAEGIETALSASLLFGLPCWATLGTERFARVSLPSEVETLVLFLDNDAGGRRAERLARAAFAGMPIEARYPRQRGADWNDVLRARPRPAFVRPSPG